MYPNPPPKSLAKGSTFKWSIYYKYKS